MITENGVFQIIFYLFLLLLLVKPLGWYMAQVYDGQDSWIRHSSVERFFIGFVVLTSSRKWIGNAIYWRCLFSIYSAC